MKLDSDDYENIYLRIREKLWLFWASLIALFGGVGLVVIYFSMSAATEKAVNKYIQTDTFKQSVIQATAAKATELTLRTEAIEARLNTSEKRIASLAALPISISENGVAIMDPSGNKFFIETGVVKDGETVKFRNAFMASPTIILSAIDDRYGPYQSRITSERSVNSFTPKVTSQGFTLRQSINHRTYNWVALGQ